jgi:hypothetical protein
MGDNNYNKFDRTTLRDKRLYYLSQSQQHVDVLVLDNPKGCLNKKLKLKSKYLPRKVREETLDFTNYDFLRL